MFDVKFHKVSNIVKEVKRLNSTSKRLSRNWSGFEFFGFYDSKILEHITYHTPPHKTNDEMMTRVENIRKRNGGQTSTLCPKSIKKRNELIHELVEYVSFGDVKSKFCHFDKEV